MSEPEAQRRTRTFVAIQLPASVRTQAGRLAAELAAQQGGWRAVPEDRLHLTLAFLGDLGPDAVRAVTEATTAAAEGVVPFDLRLHRLGAFASPGSARVLWAGCSDGADEVRRLHVRLLARLPAGLVGDPEPRFEPHVTLARTRGRRPRDAAELVTAFADWESDPFGVEAVDVLASELTPTGPRYTRLGGASA